MTRAPDFDDLVGRDVPETGPISSEDISLLRAVRGQIILAMKTVR